MTDTSIAAPAILGSTLQEAALSPIQVRPAPASSGYPAIDNATNGGFIYGEITSIAGVPSVGKTLVALHAIASHLITRSDSEVALIDTTGTTSPVRLQDILVSRLSRISAASRYEQSGYVYQKLSSAARVPRQESLQAKVALMLDRVKILRVFDFAGVVEAVNEVRELLEEHDRDLSSSANPETEPSERPREIASSQDDDSKSLHDGEAQAFDTTAPKAPRIGMIIIDNIASPTSPLLSRTSIQALALISTFLRSLTHLTRHYTLCTILLNATVSSNPTANAYSSRHRQDNVSIFASATGKPALGKTYAHMIDTSIIMSRVPKRKEDADAALGEKGGWEGVNVVEVLYDRSGQTEGEWAAFEVRDGVEMIPFE